MAYVTIKGKQMFYEETGAGFPRLRLCLVGIGRPDRREALWTGLDRVDMIDIDRESGEGSDFQ